jgi:hypothetical protein
LQSDCWYTQILYGIFDEALRWTQRDVLDGTSPFSVTMWLYCITNASKRDTILEMLLHPFVRSFRVRAALGQGNWNNLLSELPKQPLPLVSSCNQIPNVAAIYLLGCPTMLYCGQALSTTGDGAGHFGASKRSCDHVKAIHHVKAAMQIRGNAADLPKKGGGLYAHRRLAEIDEENRFLCLLSVFPFLSTLPTTNPLRTALQLNCLVTLAESIDAIYLGTVSKSNITRNEFRTGLNFAHSIRPSDMPRPCFKPLNRALPISQNIKVGSRMDGYMFGGWTAAEGQTLISLISRHTSDIASSWNYEMLQNLLHGKGILKSRGSLVNFVHYLSTDPLLGIDTPSASYFKTHWSDLYELKLFLQEKQLVTSPTSSTDSFYHIPALEGGSMTFSQLYLLLHQHAFQPRVSRRDFWQSIGSHWLPVLLSVDIWDRIEGKILILSNMLV